MVIPFYKCNANNNKFIIIINSDIPNNFNLNTTNIKNICNDFANEKVDGLIILKINSQFEINYYNNDGSWETFCLNGLRCSAQIINRLTCKNNFNIICNNKTYKCEILKYGMVKVFLDTPIYKMKNVHIENYIGDYIDSGAKHFVVECQNKLPDEKEAYQISRRIRFNKKLFPEGINVNFYQILKSNKINILTYEKGIESIMHSCASGSYACMYHYCNKHNIYENIILKNKCVELIGNYNQKTRTGTISGIAIIDYKKEYIIINK